MGPENECEDDYDDYAFGAESYISRIVKRRKQDTSMLKGYISHAIVPVRADKKETKATQMKHSASLHIDKDISDTAYSFLEIRKLLARDCYDTRGYLEDTGLFSFENFTLFHKTLPKSSVRLNNDWVLVTEVIKENNLTIKDLERLHLIVTISERSNTALNMVGIPTSYLYKLALQVPVLV
jgi:hypothetical protein